MDEKYLELRKKYSTFIYHGYEVAEDTENINIRYDFEIVGLSEFHPTWTFKKTDFYNKNKENKEYLKTIDNLIFNLGMMEIISYNKLTCSKNIEVKCGELSETQKGFFKKIYTLGLGEFFFVNNMQKVMEDDDFFSINSVGEKRIATDLDLKLEGNLIPVGGGKDSTLTLEILKEYENIPCSINARGAVYETAIKAGFEKNDVYAPVRILDKNMLELNEDGFLNGHTPFSAIVAFSTIIMALITGKKYVVLSNESSADEVSVMGTKINHQYSKSFEFEQDFRKYIEQNIGKKNIPCYFSLLRPLNEFQIIKGFAKTNKYLYDFKSCNVGSKQDIWCNSCAKCLYVYIMLLAVTNKDTVLDIFKEDLLNKESLKGIFFGLANPNLNKPFECVGTKEEVRLAINIDILKYTLQNVELPYLLKEYTTEKNFNIEQQQIKETAEKICNYWSDNNNIPEEYKEKLKKYIELK